MIRRRECIAGLGSAAAWPVAVRAQQSAMPVVGYVYLGSPETSGINIAEFRKGLSETDFVEGRNVAIEYRFAENKSNRLPEMMADLTHRRVTVIAALGGLAPALAAKAATATIPIVFGTGGDPVEAGLVASLNRPGGNLTGFSFLIVELMPKRLGLLQELRPLATRFAVLVNPNSPNAKPAIKGVTAAASTIGRQVEIFNASTDREIEAAFADLARKGADGLLVSPDPLFSNRRVQLAALAARHAVPAMYYDRAFAEVGGLMSYGSNIADQYHQAGIYAGRILKGEKPADLPVLQSTNFEFVINLKTARALGMELPPTLLAIADQVIE